MTFPSVCVDNLVTTPHPSYTSFFLPHQRRRVESEMSDQVTVKVLQTGIGGTGNVSSTLIHNPSCLPSCTIEPAHPFSARHP